MMNSTSPHPNPEKTKRKKSQILYADHILQEEKVPLKDRLRRGLLASAGALLLLQTSLCLGIPQKILQSEALKPDPPSFEETLSHLAEENLPNFANQQYQLWRASHPEEAKRLDQQLREEILKDLLPLWGGSEKAKAEQYATWLAEERKDQVNPLELEGFQEALKKTNEEENTLSLKIVQASLALDRPSPKEQAQYPQKDLPQLANALRALLRLQRNPHIEDPDTLTALKDKIQNLFHEAQLPTLVAVSQTLSANTQLASELKTLERQLSENQVAKKHGRTNTPTPPPQSEPPGFLAYGP